MVQTVRQVCNRGQRQRLNCRGHARVRINKGMSTVMREWMSSTSFDEEISNSNACLMSIGCHNQNLESFAPRELATHERNVHNFDLNQLPPAIDPEEFQCMFENESSEEHIHSTAFSYNIGDVEKVNESCHSIHRIYPLTNNVRHASTLPLIYGDCLLHSLGDLSYECHHCKALSWKIEMKREDGNWVGRNCCSSGKVSLDPLQSPPPTLRDLLLGSDVESRAFRKNIRAYNSSLAFVSLGAHLDDQFTRGGGVYTFRIHGSTYHSIGPLVPNEGTEEVPQFAQLYVYDTEHELQNRMQGLGGLDERTLQKLQTMMHEYNPYAYSFRSMRETLQTNPNSELIMVIKAAHARSRQYSIPIGSEVAAIMPGQGECSNVGHRDIRVNFRGGGLHRITNLNQSYMPLMYVLLFPKGEDGWHDEIVMQERTNHNRYRRNANVRRTKVTQTKFYAFRLQCREDTSACLLRGGRLLQQYIVDAYSSIEESRLKWIRHNQPSLRSEVYQGLADMVTISDGSTSLNGVAAGRRIVLPSSFTGGPRFMHQLYQDSMAIVRKKGKPDLFITFTCNPNWDDIQKALLPGQTAQDRPDLTARVFYEKHKDMMHLLVKRALFGKVAGFVSVIEFQKRGLPHAHILLILENQWKPTDTTHYDKLVCAELPDKDMFPELYEIITHSNIHGPCGVFNMNSPCMVNGRCKYRYPRSFSETTVFDDNGYPTYMRRDTQSTIQVKGNTLDCRWVVPYNPFLSLRYKAHINIEVCSTITAVKYLYKYVYKGHDRATVQLLDSNGVVDEISKFLDARYVSASEACWRIYENDLHEEKPDVQRLQVHLPQQNTVIFNDCDDIRDVLNNERNQKTTLTEWFIANQLHDDANSLLYMDFPCHWVWNKGEAVWTRRKRGNTIGRMYSISPAVGEQYYLRMLLTVCKGCKSFEDLRTFDGILYPNFKAACLARGLLESDDEWCICLQEAAFQKTGHQLRQLFVVILVFCEPAYPGQLWDKFSLELSEDFFHSLQLGCGNISACQSLAKTYALMHVQDLLQQYGKRLCDFEGMPFPDACNVDRPSNSLLMEETMFDHQEQADLANRMQETLNDCQQRAYNTVLEVVSRNEGGVFFLDGPGGSGKTYLYNTLLARLRGEKKIALACASSGIAAILLANGRTAHSRFKIPLILAANSTCNIKVNSPVAEIMKLASLIIWDEAPMIHRYAFEALDRTLQDIMGNHSVFGGKVMLFGGDFRQILPVVMKGSREEIVDATLCRSILWRHVRVLKLTHNMRIIHSVSNVMEHEFSEWILGLGNGSISRTAIDDSVIIPQTMLLHESSLQSLIQWVYGNLHHVQDFARFFKDRAMLAPRNQDVDELNQIALNAMMGQEIEFLSADSVSSTSNSHDSILYTTEYLNNLNLGGGYPPHRLVLKENAPIILLRNLDPRRGLCNGTRLICKRFHSKVIEAEVITGTNIGEMVFIPRITFMPTTLQLPFDMRRRQFPVKLAFGMTINKSQGQTLSIMGLYLPTPVFTHGQLYVAMSRVRSIDAVKVCIKDGGASRELYTDNIVYKEVLQMASTRL